MLCLAVSHIKREYHRDRSRPLVVVLDKELCNGLQQQKKKKKEKKTTHKQININMNRAATTTGEFHKFRDMGVMQEGMACVLT